MTAGRLASSVAGMALALVLGACAGGTDIVVDSPGGVSPSAAAAPASGRGGGAGIGGSVEAGRRLATERNCVSCHSADGSDGVGPSWRGVYGTSGQLIDGRTVTADRAYLVRSIRQPQAEVVAGFDVVEMPTFELTPDEIDDLVAYIESLG